MKVRKCEECIRRKTMYCPNTKICYSTENKPYYLDNIMANEVIEKLKNEIDKKDKVIDLMAKEIKKQYCEPYYLSGNNCIGTNWLGIIRSYFYKKAEEEE